MNFKKYRILTIIPALVALLFTASCEDVIEIELTDAKPQIVIEAKLYNNPLQATSVSLSESTEYFGSFEYKPISGAEVSILDSAGTVLAKVEESEDVPGTYFSPFYGESGHKYTLEVVNNEDVYTATGEMKDPIAIDSIYADTIPIFPYQQPGNYFLHAFSTNPPMQRDYMQYLVYINFVPAQSFYLFDDMINDGKELEFRFFEEQPEAGDTVIIELRTLDKTMYEYLYALSNVAIDGVGGPPTTPFNPKSNISGGALGYFGVFAIDAKYILIPPKEEDPSSL